ncbi:mRNA-decapping enzyme 2 [Pleurostoma richardsiae]|uniref:mRNA-decapping enzyme 2 n=1 Tax=Pleurostoma richardsiae TaxID=41990 RepID=A0AA38VUI2_9PEZI|nr:mRNA-decapping enzyme 2 [Pleurostoma richardsiae]
MTETKMQLEDWLDDLCVRFIINLPQEDLSSVARICFQVEEAQWFYEDFVRPLDPTLPSMTLRSFCLRIFQHCPLLAPFSVENHMKAFEEFLQYKTRVPVRGAILLNEAMDSTVLVKGWKKGANWSFPRGKINKDEDDLECAIREVFEETGFDIRAAGLVPPDDQVKYIEVTMREQQLRLYVFRNVPMDTHFEPRTRKEISKIQWYKLSELPAFRKKGNHQPNDAAAASNANKFYMVAPFLVPLKKWVVQQKKKDAEKMSHMQLLTHPVHEEAVTEEEADTQTDAPEAPPTMTPAIDTLEGATRELQRLLKVQPPTQGALGGSPSGQSQGSQGQDKGGALLAILQAKGEGAPQQPHMQPGNAYVPHTPLDMTYNTAPEPRTPHHHHPIQRLPLSSYQAPPSFPIPPNLNQSFGAPYQQFGQRAPQVNPHIASQDAAFMIPPQHHQRPPVPLMHPQPLPPQVQQTLLTRGMLPTPAVPESGPSVAMGPGPLAQPPHNANPAGLPGIGPCLPNQPVRRLNDHSMSLLNAFRSDNKTTEQVKQASSRQEHSSVEVPRPNQQQSVNWGPLTTAYSSKQDASFTSTMGRPLGQMAMDNSLQVTGPRGTMKPPQATEKQRSALLEMFKSSNPVSPPRGGTDASKEQYTEPSVPQGRSYVPASQPGSTAEAISAAAQANGGPIQMNPELNLPFGALSLLSRSQKQEEAPVKPVAPSQAKIVAPAKVPQQFVRGPETHRGPTGPGPILSQAQNSNLPPQTYQGLISPHAGTSFPAPSVLQRRQEGGPEQKQKLLSLFGKPKVSPSGSFSDDKNKSKETAMLDHARSGTPRARMASIASASGDGAPESASMSRRGSQTPISPADRSFLLGYLQSVTNSAAR